MIELGTKKIRNMIKRFFAFVLAVAMAISASAQSDAGSLTWQPNVGVTYTTGIVDGLDDPGRWCLWSYFWR